MKLTNLLFRKETPMILPEHTYVKCNCGRDFTNKPSNPEMVVLVCKCGAVFNLKGEFIFRSEKESRLEISVSKIAREGKAN